jgi:hypothetical protein
MISRRSPFFRFLVDRNGRRDWILSGRAAIAPRKRQDCNSSSGRAVTIEEYFAQPRASALSREEADSELVARAAEYAQELFGCAARVERDCDPESPGYCWFNVCVTSGSAREQLRHLREKWYEHLSKLELSDPTLLRLIIYRPV